jgi:hypothetical protein
MRKDTFKGEVGEIKTLFEIKIRNHSSLLVSIFNACVVQHEMENECE